MPIITTEYLDELNVSGLTGTEWFVRTDGNDSNSGRSNTSGGAFLTIAHALSVVSPGDTVSINDGTYHFTPIHVNSPNQNNVTLAGINGSSGVTLQVDNDANYAANAGALFQVSGVQRFTFTGLTLSGSTGSMASSCVSLILVNQLGFVQVINCTLTLPQFDFELLHPVAPLPTPVAVAGFCVRAGDVTPLVGPPAGTPGSAYLHNCILSYYQYSALFVDGTGSILHADGCTLKGVLSLIGATPDVIQRGLHTTAGAQATLQSCASIDLSYNGPTYGLSPGWSSGYAPQADSGVVLILGCSAATCDAGCRLVSQVAGAVLDRFVCTSPFHNGIWLAGSPKNWTITRSTVTGAAAVGIAADAGATGNVVRGNTASGSGTFDAQDLSTGGGTAGTANNWSENTLTTKSPAGLQ